MNPETPTTPNVPQPPVAPAPQPYAPQPADLSTPPSSSNRALIISIIVTVAVLVLGAMGYLAYSMFFSPQAKAKRTSSSYMKAITAGDTTEAVALSTASSDDEKEFIEQSAKAVDGSYKLSESTFVDDKGYYLYSLTDAESNYARTIVEKSGDKWLVSSFVYGDKKLLLVPKESDDSDSAAKPDDTPADTSACLVPSDYDGIYKDINGATRPSNLVYAGNVQYTQNVHFLPDSLNYDSTTQANDMINAFAGFYKGNSDKAFTIHLTGSVATTAQADLDFAKQRAQKVADALKTGGVSAAYIVIDTPRSVSAYGGDQANNATAQQTARNVVLKIVPEADCASADTSTGR